MMKFELCFTKVLKKSCVSSTQWWIAALMWNGDLNLSSGKQG